MELDRSTFIILLIITALSLANTVFWIIWFFTKGYVDRVKESRKQAKVIKVNFDIIEAYADVMLENRESVTVAEVIKDHEDTMRELKIDFQYVDNQGNAVSRPGFIALAGLSPEDSLTKVELKR